MITSFRTAFCVVFCVSFLSFGITGRVVDATGKPVASAYVSYTALDHRLLYAYSDADGKFILNSPGVVGMRPFLAPQVAGGINPTVMGSTLSFSMQGKEAVFSIFDLTGRNVSRFSIQAKNPGRYSIEPFSRLSRAVYVVQISNAGQRAWVRMTNTGKSRNGAPRVRAASAETAFSLAKALDATAANQIRAGKTGYAPALKDFTGYSDNVGDMQIATIDIEAKVDSVIQLILAHPNKKGILVGQSIMPPENSTSTIVPFNASIMFYGINGMMTKEQRLALSNRAVDSSMVKSASHMPIPLIVVGDLVHGMVYGTDGGVVLPHNIGLGCSFDTKIVEKCYRVSALESKGAGFNFAFAPCSDVARNLKYGRVYESFSEEPTHTSIMTKAAVLGFQTTDLSHPWAIGATIKHFAAAGGTKDGKQFGIANTATDSILRKIHLAPYQASIEADACAVMAAFNSWVDASGKEMAMHGNKELLTNTLKGSMGFKGFVIGDFEAHWYMQGFFTSQLTAYTGTDVRMGLGSICLNAGVDVPLGGGVSSEWDWATNGIKAYDNKLIDDTRLTDLARRILRVKFKMGLFNGTNHKFSTDLTATIKSQLHKDVARDAVRKSLVCLKNTKSALPLKKNANIHIVGTLADNMGCQCGGWTYGGASTWQGDTKTAIPAGTSIRGAITNACTGIVTYSATAAGIPATADIIVVVTGEVPYSETRGEDQTAGWDQFGGVFNKVKSSMTLAEMPEGNIINQVRAATTKPVVAVLISGRPMVLGTSLTNSDAFVCAWLPGTEGDGVADVLFGGSYDFTGKLSFSWPNAAADEPVNYGNWGDTKTAATPLFPYNFGLKLDGTQLPATWN